MALLYYGTLPATGTVILYRTSKSLDFISLQHASRSALSGDSYSNMLLILRMALALTHRKSFPFTNSMALIDSRPVSTPYFRKAHEPNSYVTS